MSTPIELDEMGMSAADAVMLTPADITAAARTRAAVRAYLMASGESMVAPFQVAAEAIAVETKEN